MASAPHQYEYSVVSYLNEATVLLRMSTADVLPKWAGLSSLRDVNNAGARTLATIAESVSELLVTKLSLTDQLHAETDNDARWNIYNQMSGLRNGVRNREAKAQRGVTATLLLTNALKLLTEFDAKLTVLLNEAHHLNSLMQGVASQHLKEPVPQNVVTLLDDMHRYNDSSKAVFWNLLDPNRSWNLDKERIDTIHRLGAINEYPQASVLWARWLCPQVEAIEQKASSIARDVQLRRGTWHLIENYLGNVDRLLGKEDATDRMSWYEDAFSILAKTQLRMMKEVAAQCAEYS